MQTKQIQVTNFEWNQREREREREMTAIMKSTKLTSKLTSLKIVCLRMFVGEMSVIVGLECTIEGQGHQIKEFGPTSERICDQVSPPCDCSHLMPKIGQI